MFHASSTNLPVVVDLDGASAADTSRGWDNYSNQNLIVNLEIKGSDSDEARLPRSLSQSPREGWRAEAPLLLGAGALC